ncbi:arginine--tRNA ligase [Portibacter lacus]|uniref:Arginine--tRNA ligase n=1 Tax=Portibacter lacus TaxID=1099794 RepID=A0AA37WCY6_9BACT|nr:arginine--tRNA ligase [Portibacter lacus]GLR16273.1 arginine--tRNA ligase [Portibacter lacus]
MTAIEELKGIVYKSLKDLWEYEVDQDAILINETRSEFEGDYTVVVFPFTKALRLPPPKIAEMLGEYLVEKENNLIAFNVIKGFLNLTFSNDYWKSSLSDINTDKKYGFHPANGKKVLVEFSSPNTNKPLHLGHIRNILLGWSSAQLLEAAGYEVVKAQIVNDRGIAICKSMLAYQLFGNGTTPEKSGTKGDHLIGEFYVKFETSFKEEYAAWQETAEGKEIYEANKKEGEEEVHFYGRYKNTYFNTYSNLGLQAKAMLLKWEEADEETIALWQRMNSWVYEGFEQTYKELGVHFDHNYYESNTYKLGKELISDGLASGVFYKKDDGSIWADLEDVGMDQKIVLRSDGTSVYMTQDIGTAHIRYEDHGCDRMVYVVGNEQDYHFEALFEILKKLDEPYAHELFHLSYGMVDLPTGKMKSREGTVVDADDLIADVIEEARLGSKSRGELDNITKEEQDEIFRKIGLAALKYFIIKVNPKKRMTFDPKESVDMQGQTGPYIQNAYVRIQSILRKSENLVEARDVDYKELESIEIGLIRKMEQFSAIIEDAAEKLDPSNMANYCYDLAKMYHRFYHEFKILSAESEEAKQFRLKLSEAVAQILKTGMELLGIEMPERM